MADFEAWRSREIRWLKARKNGKGEAVYVDKSGRTYPAETVKREFERLEPEAPKD